MPQFQLPYEIIKLFNVTEDPITGEKRIDLDKNYARYIQDNFDTLTEGMGVKWTDWTPTYSASGSMTYTSITTRIAKYYKNVDIVYFILSCEGTTGGIASTALHFTLPIPCADSGEYNIGGGCHVRDAAHLSGNWLNLDANTIRVGRYDGANWGLGAGRRIIINGFYRINIK